MTMLVHVKNMSLWEVAHYWHDLDPRESKTHDLPLKVRDTLLVLSMSYSKKLSIRVEQDKAYLLEIYNKANRVTSRHYRQTFKKAIDNKVFGKRFYSKMFVSRSQLARWCVKHNEPLPKFWFPDNDKYPYDAEGDISDEITVNGRYKVMLLYDDTAKSSGEPSQDQPIVATVNSNAMKAAQAKHAPMNDVKSRFISFYLAEGAQFPNRAESARHFFDSLDQKDSYLFTSKETATRTLLSALREHLRNSKVSE